MSNNIDVQNNFKALKKFSDTHSCEMLAFASALMFKLYWNKFYELTRFM